MKYRAPLLSILVCALFPTLIGRAQSPTPIIVQAASAMTTKSTSVAPVAPDIHSIPDAIKLLEQIKAANEEILSKQKAALQRLDELQKAADQLKIFTRRSTG